MVSFGFLLGTGPLQTSHCAHWSLTDGVLHRLVPQLPSQNGKSLNMQVLSGADSKLCTTVLDVAWCFSGQSPSFPWDNRYYNPVNGSLPPHGWVVGLLPKSWLVASSISAKACGFMVNIWSLTLGSWPMAVGPVAMWVAQVQVSLSKCSSAMGPTLGAKFCHWVFLSLSLREGQVLGPWGYETLRLCWGC